MSDVQPQRGQAETAGQDRRQTPADVTREPTGGQELREAMGSALHGALCSCPHVDAGTGFYFRTADEDKAVDALLALPEMAALLADADNWRRATTGDPTEPEPLAMQARALLVQVRRVRALAETWSDCQETTAGGRVFRHCGREVVRALDGEPQP